MRLLLDSHVARALAEQLRGHGIDAVALPEWNGGNYRNADDEKLLSLAHADRRVLVTFDCQTIPPLLKEIAETGQHHGGVVLVSSRTFRANDVGGLLHALLSLFGQRGDADWEDVAVYLRS
ncbi:MAG: DUF5615 family PIN-like protein [Chloroflexi bacterium]|nr:DUF5615 family PIN-like protein [Chloroflexota bacterium]